MQYHLKVATLNFSGINISPFEYHDGSEQKNFLDKAFKTIFDNNVKQNTKSWNIAKIDKVFQKERYTILYQPDCGCVRGKLLTKQQFQIVWDRTFDQNQSIVSHMNLNDECINRLRSFDYMIYKSYLDVIFGEVDMKNLSQYSSVKFLSQLKKWHSKAYLNQNTKINYVKQYIVKQELDVLFLQEALTDRALEYLPSQNYSFVKNADSMIIFKKQTYFLHDYEEIRQFGEKYKELLNFNNDSCYFKSADILLLSVHLSSKKTHTEQAKQMFETLKRVQRQNLGLKIIMGIDANHKLQVDKSYKMFPQVSIPTTRKKRTTLQCQFQKSNKLIEQSKDFIITNMTMTSSKIQTIRSWQATHDLLPNDDHPFDHFLVSANLQFDKPTFRQKSIGFFKFFQNPVRLLFEETATESIISSDHQDFLQQQIVRVVPPETQRWSNSKKQYPIVVVRKSIHQPIPSHAINHLVRKDNPLNNLSNFKDFSHFKSNFSPPNHYPLR